MVTREEIKGHWNEVKGRLQEHWGQLTDDDLRRAEGSKDHLVGVVQQKTGATRSEVEQFLSSILQDSQGTVQRVSDAASQYADEASEIVREQYARAASATDHLSKQVAHTVRSRPTESLLIAFGLGIAAGAVFFVGRNRR
ncbi:MAG: CsbD family protein [Pirellulaceae bacterium]|nr:CsbD family protein [Pirellulaceae bacterium]